MAKRRKAGAEPGVPLMIQGTPVRVVYKTLPLSDIQLDPENPRIRLQVERKFGDEEVTQDELASIVKDQPGFPELQRAIRKNKGLHDPLIVRHDGMVAEGNSRATVLRVLNKGNLKIDVPVMQLPKSIGEHVVAALLASYHVAGKTPWRPYAKGEHIYRLRTTYSLTDEEITDATRMSAAEIQHYIDAFEYFEKELAPGADAKVLEAKFSHALEFVKRKNLAGVRADPEQRKAVTEAIKKGKIKGIEVRHVDKVFASPKATRAFKKGGYAAAKKIIERRDPTLASKHLKAMETLTKSLGKLKAKEIEQLFKDNSKARKILTDLLEKLTDTASMVEVWAGQEAR